MLFSHAPMLFEMFSWERVFVSVKGSEMGSRNLCSLAIYSLRAWQAYNTLTQLFEGNLPQFHPDPYPGLPSFFGSEHPDPLANLLSTEFQVCNRDHHARKDCKCICLQQRQCALHSAVVSVLRLRLRPACQPDFFIHSNACTCSSSPTSVHSWII
jgi:hypothetical protein